MTPEWFSSWVEHLHAAGPCMSSTEAEACARLATVLLCGEQSAIRIFAAEVQRGRAPAAALSALGDIERDEQLHEQALDAFCDYLPRPDDALRIKRRAQRFFLGLGRIDDMARHFGQISHLDSAVCKIMWHVESSSLERLSPLRLLAEKIKKDEARHVAVSRNYASYLGLSKRDGLADSALIRDALVDMLDPLGDSFEVLGVDTDRLFSGIRKENRA